MVTLRAQDFQGNAQPCQLYLLLQEQGFISVSLNEKKQPQDFAERILSYPLILTAPFKKAHQLKKVPMTSRAVRTPCQLEQDNQPGCHQQQKKPRFRGQNSLAGQSEGTGCHSPSTPWFALPIIEDHPEETSCSDFWTPISRNDLKMKNQQAKSNCAANVMSKMRPNE